MKLAHHNWQIDLAPLLKRPNFKRAQSERLLFGGSNPVQCECISP